MQFKLNQFTGPDQHTLNAARQLGQMRYALVEVARGYPYLAAVGITAATFSQNVPNAIVVPIEQIEGL